MLHAMRGFLFDKSKVKVTAGNTMLTSVKRLFSMVYIRFVSLNTIA